MPPKKDIIVNIQDEEHFLKYINHENKKIVVVDVHPQWSGRCEMMFPTYKSLLTSIDDFDKRVDILMVPIENVKGYKNDKFHRDNTTKPKFVFFQEGKVVDEVNGADIPNVVDKIIKYLPMVY